MNDDKNYFDYIIKNNRFISSLYDDYRRMACGDLKYYKT